jgi:predicted nuclease with TOPRIM domain
VQVQNDLVAENEKLQERMDELGADVYLLRQENAELRKSLENLSEVCCKWGVRLMGRAEGLPPEHLCRFMWTLFLPV